MIRLIKTIVAAASVIAAMGASAAEARTKTFRAVSPDADTNAEHYTRREFTIKAGEPLKVKLAPGGGFAAKFSCK